MKFALFAVALTALALPSHAATIASFNADVSASFTASPGQEISISSEGIVDKSESNSSGNSSANINTSGAFGSSTLQPIGSGGAGPFTSEVDADAGVTSTGAADANGDYDLVFNFANFGNQVETITMRISYDLKAASSVDPGVGGTAAGGGSLDIELNGRSLLTRQVSASGASGNAQSTSLFESTFTVDPTNNVSKTLRISLTGGAKVDAAAVSTVPLPAAGLLLMVGLGGLAAVRRRTS